MSHTLSRTILTADAACTELLRTAPTVLLCHATHARHLAPACSAAVVQSVPLCSPDLTLTLVHCAEPGHPPRPAASAGAGPPGRQAVPRLAGHTREAQGAAGVWLCAASAACPSRSTGRPQASFAVSSLLFFHGWHRGSHLGSAAHVRQLMASSTSAGWPYARSTRSCRSLALCCLRRPPPLLHQTATGKLGSLCTASMLRTRELGCLVRGSC